MKLHILESGKVVQKLNITDELGNIPVSDNQLLVLEMNRLLSDVLPVRRGDDLLLVDKAQNPFLVLEDFYLAEHAELYLSNDGQMYLLSDVNAWTATSPSDEILHALADITESVAEVDAVGTHPFFPIAAGGMGAIAALSLAMSASDSDDDKESINFTGNLDNNDISDGTTDVGGSIDAKDAEGNTVAIDAATSAGNYGEFDIDSDGNWNYTLDGTVETLGAGETSDETFTIKTVDGEEQVITITITGKDDDAVIAGDTDATVEDSNGATQATGTLTISDVDQNDNPSFNDDTQLGDFGTLTVQPNGQWTYDLDSSKPATTALNAGETQQETVTVTASDGSTQTITLTITGSDDAAVVSGQTTGTATEDASTAATGTIAISDPDSNDNPTFVDTTLDGDYGHFELIGNDWTYNLDNTAPATQNLDEGETATDTFTITDSEGNPHNITITVTGTKDTTVISGTATGTVSEDGVDSVSNTLTVTSTSGQAAPNFVDTTLSGNYGELNFAGGQWTYTLDNNKAQAIGENDTQTETFSVATTDDTKQTITVQITGQDDLSIITGNDAGNVTEQATANTATGTLTISDVDANDTPNFTAESIDGTYGALAMTASGAWTYTLDNDKVATQALNEGEAKSENFAVKGSDGAEQIITITVTGKNNVAEVTGATTGEVTEDASPNTATGKLTITDVDSNDSPDFEDTSLVGTYGDFACTTDGNWTYTLNNGASATQALTENDKKNEIFVVKDSNGTSHDITISVNGVKDTTQLTGETTGNVVEDATASASGSVSATSTSGQVIGVNDVTANGEYGEFKLVNGDWTYTLDNTKAQSLDDQEVATENFTVTTTDGVAQTIAVTVTGAEDAPVISGETAGNVTEQATANTATGTLSISDVDTNDTPSFTAESITGNYGALAMTASGAWTYTLENDKVATQALNEGEAKTENFAVKGSDGAEQIITITVAGKNNVAEVTGATTGEVTEDATPNTATGKLTITDVDSNDSPDFEDTSLVGTYGDFACTTDGNWTYTLNNGASATQALTENDKKNEIFVVKDSNGTSHDITISVNGVKDTTQLTGETTGNVVEDGTASASGSVSATSTSGQAIGVNDVTANGEYGEFKLVDGDWTYTLDNTKAQSLDDKEVATENFTVTTTDGVAQTIAVTVTGAEDAPVINGETAGSVTEQATANTATGTLTISDVDANDTPNFTAESIIGNYGALAMTASGAWTYTLDNDKVATQALNEGEAKTENFAVKGSDGAEQIIVITVAGKNNVAEVTGSTTGEVTEDATPNTATGKLTITDVDSNDNPDFVEANETGTYGSFAVTAGGDWTYTLNNGASATQALTENDKKTETFAVKDSDGKSHEITITVNGVKDTIVTPPAPDAPEYDEGYLGVDNRGAGEIDYSAASLQTWGSSSDGYEPAGYRPFTYDNDILVVAKIGSKSIVDMGAFDAEDMHDSATINQNMNYDGMLKMGAGNDFVLIKDSDAEHGLRDESQIDMGAGYDFVTLGYIAQDATASLGADNDILQFTGDVSANLLGSIDGQAGFDTLQFSTTTGVLDNLNGVTGIEHIDLHDGESSTLTIESVATLQTINASLTSSADLGTLVSNTTGAINSEVALSDVLHIGGDSTDKLNLFDEVNWSKGTITHSLDDIWARSANADGDVDHIENVSGADDIDHAKPEAMGGNYTLYTYDGSGEKAYLFIEDGVSII